MGRKLSYLWTVQQPKHYDDKHYSTEHLPILTKVEAIIETIKNQQNAA